MNARINLEEKVFSVRQVAGYLQVSDATVTSWIEKGKLYAIDAAGVDAKIRQWRIPESSIIEFRDNRSNRKSTTTKPKTTKKRKAATSYLSKT